MISILEFNVWLDVAFASLYVVVLLALSAHFLGNVFSGRAKRRLVGWEWPHHEGPPIPSLPKFLHFQHFICMFLLALSGLLIRFPGFIFSGWDDVRTVMRWIHYVAMIGVTIILVWRLWYAFFSSRRDYKEFSITKKDIVTAPKVVFYYIFVRSSKPHFSKYNVLQKATYTIFVPLLIIQALTGFALLTAPIIFGLSPRDILVGWWLGVIVGSTDMAGWYMRIAHYIVSWVFIILTTIHVYLAGTEDFPAFLDFFGLSVFVRESADHEEHDEHGHASSPAFTKGD